jgi:hypothetical protein
LPNITTPQFAKSDVRNATADDENADILKNHFQAVFDRRDVTTDETVIDEIEELEGVKQAINKMKREKVPEIRA